jgi:hypothetical protein
MMSPFDVLHKMDRRHALGLLRAGAGAAGSGAAGLTASTERVRDRIESENVAGRLDALELS